MFDRYVLLLCLIYFILIISNFFCILDKRDLVFELSTSNNIDLLYNEDDPTNIDSDISTSLQGIYDSYYIFVC